MLNLLSGLKAFRKADLFFCSFQSKEIAESFRQPEHQIGMLDVA